MAEIITQKERKRRFWTIIICISVDVIAIGLGAYAMIKTDELRKAEPNAVDDQGNKIETIETVTKDCLEIMTRIEPIKDNARDFSDPWGWVNYSTDTHHRFSQSHVVNKAIKDYLDQWTQPRQRHSPDRTTSELQELFLTAPQFSQYFEMKEVEKTDRTGPTKDDFDYKYKEMERVDSAAGQNTPVVTKLIEMANEEHTKLVAEKEKLEQAINQSRQAETTALGEIRKAHRDAVAQLPQPIADYRRLMDEFNAKEKANFEELQALEVQAAEVRKTRNETIAQLNQERVAYEAKLETLKTRVRNMKVVIDVAELKADPDGRILQVDLADGLVRVDLNRDSRVFNFTRFRVFSVEKGLQRATKGEIEIIEVHDTYSVGRIERMKEENPFKPGDFIWNARHDPKLPNYFIVAGKLTKWSRGEIQQKLMQFGDVYQDKLDEHSQYCIVGEGYESDPIYKEASERGMRIFTERHLYRYLGFPHD
jgi:hypothetical protein